jgi:DNA-binding NarL/FixJ family response regulator
VNNPRSDHRARRLRVYLVEDSTIMVGLLRDLLAIDPGIELVGGSTTARAAIRDIAALAPDVAIVDIALQDSSGFDVLKALARNPSDPQPVRIVLSNFATDRYRAEAARLGADHFFDKNGEILDLLRALTAIAERDGSRSDSLI